MNDKKSLHEQKTDQLLKRVKIPRSVNKSNIREHFRKQPSRVAQAGADKAYCEKHLSRTKRELEITRARISKKIRGKYRDSGDKLTEGSLKELLQLNKKVVAAEEKVDDAQYLVSMSWASINGISEKSKSLENMGYDLSREKTAIRNRNKGD